MLKIIAFLKVTFFLLLLSSVSSCKKEIGSNLVFRGRILDKQTLEPLQFYVVGADQISGNSGISFGFGNSLDISHSVTDNKGQFSLVIDWYPAKDTSDEYVIKAVEARDHYGFSIRVNAKQAEKNGINLLGDILVYKSMMVDFTVVHLGESNPEDDISIAFRNVFGTVFELFYGDKPIIQRQYFVPPNTDVFISWYVRKNKIFSETIRDTVRFNSDRNSYLIEY